MDLKKTVRTIPDWPRPGIHFRDITSLIQNPAAFKQIRTHLMALFHIQEAAIDSLGPEDTKEIMDDVVAAIARLRAVGSGEVEPE